MIAVLAVLAYLPAFGINLIADDYPQIQMSRLIARDGGAHDLFANPSERLRMTFFVVTYGVERFAGLDPAAYHGVSLALHILCCWLVYGLGAWELIGFRLALIAAGFFAVFDGHQEAVMWYSGLMEALVVAFGLAAVVCFIRWLRGGRWTYYVLAVACLGLAMFSKESAYVFAGLMILPVIEMELGARRRAAIVALIPLLLVALGYIAWIAYGRAANPRFSDGSFAITPHVFRVLLESSGRLLFPWGVLALGAVVIFRARASARVVIYSLIWMAAGLVPYSFLTYMSRVPSRHTYLASVGLAILVAVALGLVWDRLGGRMVLAVAAIILIVNTAILWKTKATQYRARALPTDTLINALHRADGPVHIRCYPYLPIIAESVAKEFGGRVEMEPGNDVKQKYGARCLNLWYRDAIGNVREVFIPPSRLP